VEEIKQIKLIWSLPKKIKSKAVSNPNMGYIFKVNKISVSSSAFHYCDKLSQLNILKVPWLQIFQSIVSWGEFLALWRDRVSWQKNVVEKI
jgi:hypothetical protein